MSLLRKTKYGIYCQQGDFYIDATGRVDRNVVTHAHADHARPGHKSYLASNSSELLLRSRLGKRINIQTLAYNTSVSLNGVKISLHPSGHIYGAAQVRIAYKGEVWVVTGDYKLEDDRLSEPFEPVKCHHFITECTFGLPVYQWTNQHEVYTQINDWWLQNKQDGITSILFGYSLGKSQRIIKNIDHGIGPVYVHRSVGAMNEAIRQDGADLPPTTTIDDKTNPSRLKGQLIIAPPSFSSGAWIHELGDLSFAMASGWVLTGKNMGRGKQQRGFVLSDHVDWDDLMKAIDMTNAQRVITMHGYTKEVTRWLNENGVSSIELDDLQNIPFKLD